MAEKKKKHAHNPEKFILVFVFINNIFVWVISKPKMSECVLASASLKQVGDELSRETKIKRKEEKQPMKTSKYNLISHHCSNTVINVFDALGSTEEKETTFLRFEPGYKRFVPLETIQTIHIWLQ